MEDEFLEQFRRDGFVPELQMYMVTASNIQSQSDSTLLNKSLVIDILMLFLICTTDAVCIWEMMDVPKGQVLVPDLKEVIIDCAHWSPIDKADEVATHIKDFDRPFFQVDKGRCQKGGCSLRRLEFHEADATPPY